MINGHGFILNLINWILLLQFALQIFENNKKKNKGGSSNLLIL